MEQSHNSYVVITPARNEAAGIEDTILRMAAQTIRPLRWVIVNDGSKDETGRILDDYSKKYYWITALHRPDRGFRSPGGGVVEAFMEGSGSLPSAGWKYIVKFDADLNPEADYFERCIPTRQTEA